MAEKGEYRIEVSSSLFTVQEYVQFFEAARQSGFTVLRENYHLTVSGLTERQAITLRDGLERLGFHSSIGISVHE